MGTSESQPHPFMSEPYFIVDSPPNDDNINEQFVNKKTVDLLNFNKLRKFSFHGVCSMVHSDSITPEPRSSHFTVNIPEIDGTVIGYGINKNGEQLNDVWVVSHKLRKWKRLDVDTSSITPRNGTVAVMGEKNVIWLFGGYLQNKYLQDLHTIDLATGKVTFPQTTGDVPPPRTGHLMVYRKGKIYIWGGYNGDWLTNFYILDTQTLQWRVVDTEIRGRTSIAWCVLDDYLYIFGASRNDGLLRFSFKNETLTIVKTCGIEPPCEVVGGMLIPVGKYLLLIGGRRSERKYGLIYALDTEQNKWFVFHVVPDGTTVSIADGNVSKEGYFMSPILYHASGCYRQNAKEIVVFFGVPYVDPPLFFCIVIGEALGVLNMQSDMRQMLKKF